MAHAEKSPAADPQRTYYWVVAMQYVSTALRRIDRAFVFSILSAVTALLNKQFATIDIVISVTTLYFVCNALRVMVFGGRQGLEKYHLSHVFNAITRQSVLVVVDTLANSVHLRDVGTQTENTVILLLSTTILVAAICLVPTWLVKDDDWVSMRAVLLYTFTSRYSQVHVPGLSGSLGMILYALVFVASTALYSNAVKHGASMFIQTIYQAVSMISSNIFLVAVTPTSSSQVLPLAILIGFYVVSSSIDIETGVAGFILWRTAREIMRWVKRMYPARHDLNRGLLYAFVVAIIPATELFGGSTVADAFFLGALQGVIDIFIGFFDFKGQLASIIATISVLLCTDIFMSIYKRKEKASR